MSGDYCDDKYTFTPKPAAPSYTEVAKPAAPSYTITEKSTTSSSITGKPCLELLAILAEDGIEITEEDTRVLVVEGAL